MKGSENNNRADALHVESSRLQTRHAARKLRATSERRSVVRTLSADERDQRQRRTTTNDDEQKRRRPQLTRARTRSRRRRRRRRRCRCRRRRHRRLSPLSGGLSLARRCSIRPLACRKTGHSRFLRQNVRYFFYTIFVCFAVNGGDASRHRARALLAAMIASADRVAAKATSEPIKRINECGARGPKIAYKIVTKQRRRARKIRNTPFKMETRQRSEPRRP